ncbi:MAG: AraC family transcriptional regulator [Sandaracinaceae bacterium]
MSIRATSPASGAPLERIPAAHALHLADVAEGLGVPRERLFAAWAVTEAELVDPDRWLDVRTLRRWISIARRLSGEEALGLWLGARMQVSNHGSLGFAAMTAPTIRHALDVAIRFIPTRTRALGLSYRVEGARAAITLEERADLGEARDVVLVALVVGIWRIGQALTVRTLAGDVDFAFDAPAYAEHFGALAPGTVRFGRPSTRLAFDAALLDTPLVMADPAAHRRACEQCERELHALGPSFAARVRAALAASPPPALEEVARALGVSARTLKRRLAEERVSFGSVRAETLRERALLLLDRGADLDTCAEALGYCDAASFGRAFKRWTGRSPGQLRR